MKKIRIRVEWACGVVKTFWKLVVKNLCFKLDQNNDLRLQALRVTYFLTDFRTCYRGNSVSEVISFSHAPPSIEDHINNVKLHVFVAKNHVFSEIFFKI